MSIPAVLFSFNGRISRFEYWLKGVLVIVAAIIVLNILTVIITSAIAAGADASDDAETGLVALLAGLGIVLLLWFLAAIPLVWISFALYAKRFHDRGKTGWMGLVVFIPLIGPFWILIECGFLPGDPVANAYGPPP